VATLILNPRSPTAFSGVPSNGWKISDPKKIAVFSVLLLALFICLPSSFAFANVLGNSDFSQPIGNGTAGNWDNTNGATRITTAPGGGFSALPGSAAITLPDFNPDDYHSGRFTFQTYNNIHPGDYVVFSVNAESNLSGTSAQGDIVIEFKKVNSDGSDTTFSYVALSESSSGGPGITINSGTAAPGSGYKLFSIAGTAPAGTQRVSFTIRTTGGTAGHVTSKILVATQANAEVNPAKLTVAASKRNVSPGDAVGINAHFQNTSGVSYQNVQMHFMIPHGFDYAPKSIRVNGHPATYQNGSIIVNVGNMAPSSEISVSFVTLVSSGVQIGKHYSLEATLNGDAVAPDPSVPPGPDVLYPGQLSQKVTVEFSVEGDPVFDQGTIIGKVFNDLNQNGVQDKGEEGIPFVRLYTEEGIGIVTDENGMYHIPGVNPGRHVVKIDGHTLPEGTKFITEEAYLVKTTPGIMSKANFAVLLPPSGIPDNFKKDLTVMITQGVDVSRPTLDVQIKPDIVKLGVGVLEKEPVFTFDNNYAKFIKKWTLEVRDELGQPVWTGYGVGQPPPEVTWTGIAESGLLVKPGMYSYQLKVRDAKNREDWTPLKFFEVMTKSDPKAKSNYHPEIPPVGDFNLFKDGKRSIPLNAKPVVRVQGKTKPKNKITINDTPVAVDGVTGIFQKEFFVGPGEYDVNISATTPEGETTSFNKKVKVKDSTFFMVALGEEQLGENFDSGSKEAASAAGYRDGFSQDGRAAFFLKGKIKGKFLVTAHYDTSDKSSALFTNLNPNDYYPIYGDSSTLNYEAHDTAQRLYILVEMDRSYVKWGSFKTEFTDTELATYNRTLSGLKVNFDTVESTVYGDPKRGFKVFYAKSDHRADHNELYATGGSLFYTRNRNIIEGSEKIRVEVRDKIQNMTVASYDLQAGTDYEINYGEGRIMLSRSLSSVAASDTMTSTDILDGDPVYLIVDYEYNPNGSDSSVPNEGIRGYTWIGDHLRVGATGITEKRPGGDYDMNGVDAMFKFGRNTKITAEYAQTINQQVADSISYDGGISYADISPLTGRHTRPQNSAYLIRGSSEPVKGLETTGYVQGVDPSFSNGYMQSQEGLEKYGLATRYKFTDSLSIRYRFDHNAVMSQLMPLDVTGNQEPFKQLETQTAQIVYDDGQYLAELEYQRRNLDTVESTANLTPDLTNQIPFSNGVTGKVGYHFNDRLLPYIKVQSAIDGKNDSQFGGGVRYEVTKSLFAYLEEMVGPLGDSTYFGFERQHENGARSYANIRSIDRGIGDKTLATAIGNSFALTEKSRMYSEREYSSYQGQNGYADILGYEGKADDHWDYGAKYERRHMAYNGASLVNTAAQSALVQNNAFDSVGGNLGYANGKQFRARTYWELRYNQDTPKMGQIVTRNSLQYQINEDLGFLSYFNYGDTRQYNPGNDPATLVEFSNGFAYRPIKNDKLNFLARYTYLKDLGADQQFNNSYYNGFQFDSSAHILATDIGYDVNRYFGLVEKLAYKRSTLVTSADDTVSNNTFLSANRINFHVTRKWDLALEYRILMQSFALDSLKNGALVEVDREFYEYVRLGVGYNFTDFSDDLRNSNSFKSHGPFVRMTGKF
jgi:uncharacterized repeat protein (TIGR01451 family)